MSTPVRSTEHAEVLAICTNREAGQYLALPQGFDRWAIEQLRAYVARVERAEASDAWHRALHEAVREQRNQAEASLSKLRATFQDARMMVRAIQILAQPPIWAADVVEASQALHDMLEKAL